VSLIRKRKRKTTPIGVRASSWTGKKDKKDGWHTKTGNKASWDWKTQNNAAWDTKTASWDTKDEKTASWDTKSKTSWNTEQKSTWDEATDGYWGSDTEAVKPFTSNTVKDTSIEEREYPETVFVCTHFQGSSQKKKGKENHMKIAIQNSLERIDQYLKGDNSNHEQLTANEPVFYGMSETHPEFIFETCRWLYQNDQLDSAPLPTNEGVNLKKRPKETFYVKKFEITNEEDEGRFWQMETMKMKTELMDLDLKFNDKHTFGTQDSRNKRKSEVLLVKE